MRPMQLAFRSPALFAQTFYRYYFYRLFPGLTGWNRALAPVERLSLHNAFDALFEVNSAELGDSNGVRQMLLGCYEIYIQNIFCSVLRPDDLFLDVGANAGFFSVFAASCVGPAGEVHSFEPASRYFPLLRRNADLNPEFRIMVNRIAVSDKPGTATFYPAPPSHSGGSSLEAGWLDSATRDPEETVQTVTLSEYIQSHKLQPRLIKIDVEGHEASAVRGLTDYLRNASIRPFIVCEITSEEALGRIRQILEGYGYSIRDAYRPDTTLKKLSWSTSFDLFAVPPQ